MQYIEVTFTVNPLSETANDIIAALAADLGFESFVESPEGTIGYVPASLYKEEALHEALFLTIIRHIKFKRASISYSKLGSYFLGYYYSSKVIYSSYYSCSFHV